MQKLGEVGSGPVSGQMRRCGRMFLGAPSCAAYRSRCTAGMPGDPGRFLQLMQIGDLSEAFGAR